MECVGQNVQVVIKNPHGYNDFVRRADCICIRLHKDLRLRRKDSALGHEQLTQAALCSRRCPCSHGSNAGHRCSLLLSPLHTMEQDAVT